MYFISYFYIHTVHFDLLLFVPTYAHIFIKILHFITSFPTCFGASAPSSGRFDIAFVKVII